jgi:hypothetical protein
VVQISRIDEGLVVVRLRTPRNRQGLTMRLRLVENWENRF